jgi:hypothetical protein
LPVRCDSHGSRLMRRRFQYTFTPTDRHVYQQWLVGVSAFYGCIMLLIVGVLVIRSYSGHAGNETALALQSRDAKCSFPIADGRSTCGLQTGRSER